MPPKKKISRAQAQQLLPEVSKFNGLAKMLIKLLDSNIDRREKHLSELRERLSKTIQKDRTTNINVMSVDINRTLIKKKSGYTYNQSMDWESQLKNSKRGIVL